ncbi:MAG: GNAT family N-acetyltransferase [Acidimicrobiales bacterium]|nr:GNAT family N-acetyltransferase [Acidimicrobiales bacterium]
MDSRLATPDDIDLVATICAEGFFDDPVMSWTLRDPATRRDRLIHIFRGLATEMLDEGRGVVHLVDDACASLWRTPDFDHHGEARSVDHDDGDGAAAEQAAPAEHPFDAVDLARLGVLDEVMHDHHPRERHWYLNVICTRPAAQGRGLGARALADVLARCDAEGDRIYLESTNPRNRTLYRRSGFVDGPEIPIPDGPAMLAMWRDPQR